MLSFFLDGSADRGSIEFQKLTDPFDFVVSEPVVQRGEHVIRDTTWSTIVVLVQVVEDRDVVKSSLGGDWCRFF